MGIKRELLVRIAGINPEFWSKRLQNPIFILGAARSGTTLLNDLLSHHKKIAVLSEANDLWDPSGYPWRTSNHASPPEWIDYQAFMNRWWQDTQSRITEICSVFGVYQSLSRKAFFLNKTPFNTYRIGYLLEMFPDARFIYIVRDGRAVTQSFTRKIYEKVQDAPQAYAEYDIHTGDDVTRALADFWRQGVEVVAQADEQFHLTATNRLIEISYERLCEDMRGTLEAICQFLGVSMVDFDASVWAIQAISQNEKWRKAFSPEMIQDIETRMQAALLAKNYQLSSVEAHQRSSIQ